ncbi:LuxR family transcriptional regulator [Kutzneria viridogrisea]|uniref:Sugar-specific transcriptional regulator TrmB/DNA-binding CsgD family transcriptional regulator n=1 Tax=Kutzneria viridogrisea TaxID=47990 RepID=A0ABR6BYR8_9PSEU|nr:sugar-specific transcriptional regulator TrmB/DNA-binding CsgD family transcriptional regulator [Kutzneria viridogrisea]
MLEIVGLDATAEAVYGVLVDRSPCTVDVLVRCSGSDPGTVSRALRALEERGLVVHSADDPALLTVPPPDMALEVLLLEQQERIKRARLFSDRLAERYRRAASSRSPAELVEVVSGRKDVARRIEQILRSTTEEVRFIDKRPYVVAPEDLAGVEAEMLRRGVPYRGLYDPEGLSTRDIQGRLEPTITQSEQARVLPAAPIKLILADDRLAVLPLRSSATAVESVMIVHAPALLEALSVLFEALWRSALPLPAPGAPASTTPADAPTAEDRRLIALLTAGLPDRIIARQLGLSYRTFQRRIGSLLDRLGVRTRFQAGLQAAFRGLVPAPEPQSSLEPTGQPPRPDSGPPHGHLR